MATIILWSDLKNFAYAADSANLSDSAYKLKQVTTASVRSASANTPYYGDGSLTPQTIAEGAHTVELDFEAAAVGVRPFFAMMGLTDSGYWSTNIQTAFYVDLDFYGSDSATLRLKFRAKGCRFRNLQISTRDNVEVLRGTIDIQDVKMLGAPTTE